MPHARFRPHALVAIGLALGLLAAGCSIDPDVSQITVDEAIGDLLIEGSTDGTDPTGTTDGAAADDESVAGTESGNAGSGDADPGDDSVDEELPEDASGGDITADESDPADDDAPVDPTELALGPETVDWTDCGPRLQCGLVEVPVDYDDPSLGTLQIAINVHRSADPDARIGYLFLNPGGPGVSGVELVQNTALVGFPDELTDGFDLIGFDPRGVEGSEPQFACGSGNEQFELLVQIDYPPDTPDEIEIGNDAVELCVDSMGPVASRLSSEFVARDMDEIRKALGAEQISYLGFSYGSALGGWYASLFPERVYSMVLDGADNPLDDADTVDEAVEIARQTIGPLHDQFAAALASCGDESCPIWNDGDPEAYWYGVVDKFDLLVEAKDGNADAIVLGIVGHLYSETLWPALHQSIYDLGEFDDPSGFVDAIDNAGTVDGPSFTAHVNCLDQWALFPDDTLASILEEEATIGEAAEAIVDPEFPLLTSIDIPDQASPCLFFEALDPPAFEGTFDGGGVPILVVGNTSDPITPFEKSEVYATEVLADGHLVRVEHPAHVVYPGNACVNDFVHAALIDREYPDDQPECALEEPPALDEIEFEAVTLPDGSATVVPVGWPELAPGVWTRSPAASDPVIVFVIPTFGSPEATVEFFEEEAGAQAEEVGSQTIDGVEWSLWRLSTSDGLEVRFAIRPGFDGAMIAGQAGPDEIDALVDNVLQPMVEAYVPGG